MASYTAHRVLLWTLLLAALASSVCTIYMFSWRWVLVDACGQVERAFIAKDGRNGGERPHVLLLMNGREEALDLVVSWTEYYHTDSLERRCFRVYAMDTVQ